MKLFSLLAILFAFISLNAKEFEKKSWRTKKYKHKEEERVSTERYLVNPELKKNIIDWKEAVRVKRGERLDFFKRRAALKKKFSKKVSKIKHHKKKLI